MHLCKSSLAILCQTLGLKEFFINYFRSSQTTRSQSRFYLCNQTAILSVYSIDTNLTCYFASTRLVWAKYYSTWKTNTLTISISITPIREFGFCSFTPYGRGTISLPWLVICANTILYAANLSCSSAISWLIRPGFWTSYANYITNSVFSTTA